MTLRQLPGHTGGVYDYVIDNAFMAIVLGDPTTAYTPQQLVDVAIDNGSDFSPGTDWTYSNTGYILLGMVIESQTDSSLSVEIRNRLLDPVGLNETFFGGEETILGSLATGYDNSNEELTTPLHPSASWAAGAMVATAADVARWANALYGGDLLAQQEIVNFN
ncbi:MAG: beta-lactamase family protein [Proteobacteria bacterium]|nr:beta-lactamase family protein [Pseudomonadota bacterium]